MQRIATVGETRLDVLNKNIVLFKSIIPQIVHYSPDSILVVVSNPVDILTYVTYKLSGFEKEKVIGSGTVIDSARLRLTLRREYNLPLRYLHTMILGEHGDTQVAAWSQTTVTGMRLEDYLQSLGVSMTDSDKAVLAEKVAKMGIDDIVAGKGYTNFGIAACVKRIIKAIVLNENAMLPVTVVADGEYELKEVCLSLPALVGSAGIANILQLSLPKNELIKLQASASVLKKILEKITIN